MKKKIFTLIMGLLLTALGAAAQNNGNAGPLTWNYNAGTKTLTITGEGAMPNYAYGGGTDRPWQTFKDEIETVTIGHGVTTVGQSAFTRCSKLQSITLPASLTKIGDHGFSRCTALQSIALPAALSEIGDYAFNECSALTTFEVDPGNARYTATDGVLYNKAKTSLRKYPAGKAATSFSVPAGVTYIGEYAFEAAAKLQSITLPAGVERIGKYAFVDCTALKSITLPEGLTDIGQGAFHNCTALQSITLPASLTHIRNDAFSRCTALQSITLPAALTDIDGSAFFNCTALTAIGVDAGNARFTSADGVLYNKAKTELVRYPAGKPGTAFTVPAEVKKIGNDAFGNCKLQSITLPAGLTTIGREAFLSCTALQSIAIPAAVTSIEDYAFEDCTALTEVTVAWDTPLDIPAYVFHRVTLSNVTLRVPAGKMPAYRAEAVWKNFGTITDGVLFFLAVSPATLSFVAAGETKPVTVTASGAWTAVSSEPSWLTLSAGSGTGNGSVDVTAAAYTGTTPRTAKVTFTAGSITQEVNVTQQGASAPPTLAVSPATLSFVAAGEMKPVTVTASGAWTAASDQSWLTLSTGSGTGNMTVNVTAANYTGTTPRTAKVTFTAGSVTQEVNVTQQGASAPPALAVSPATLSFVAAGETKPVTVTASGAWTAASDQSWLTLSTGSGTGNTTVNVTAANYTGTTPRTAKVTFTSGSITQEVNVTQQSGNINMSRYITLTVQSGQPIKLKFKAAAAGTPVRIVSGSNTTDVTVGTDWTANQNFTSDGTTMTVYGDIIGFGCSGNGANLTALDVSACTQLQELICFENRLTALDVSACTQLEKLSCANNRLTALDVSGCTQLEKLSCADNRLTALDVSGCTQLKGLWCHRNHLFALDISGCTRLKILDCSGNRLTALDVSACTQLQELNCGGNGLTALDVNACTQLQELNCESNGLTALDVGACTRLKELDCTSNELPALDVSACTQLKGLSCGDNQLTALDVSACTQLEELECFKNNFSIAALNRLYCSLPDRTSTTEGKIWPAFDATDPGHANVLASSGSIATGKNWKVQYYSDDSDIPTTGTKTCGPDFAVTPETVDITFAGETKPVTVTASAAWTARCDAPWITLSALSGTGNGTITVTAPAYADEWPRAAKIFFVSGALKDTVTVTQHPKPGPKFLALDYTELTLPVGASQRLVVTAYPKDADINRGVKWFSLNDDIATVSANGTVTALKPGRTDITVVANVGGQQTTCRVRVVPAEQMVSVTSGSDNTLRIALMAPSDADFTLSFDVDLPEGFALDTKKTVPDASLAARYAVTVTGNRVEMKPNGLRAGETIEKRDLLTLACTAVPGTSNGSYKGALRNLAFTPTAGYALQNVTVPFTFTYTVANETVDGLRIYASGSALHLTLPKAETVHIYNVKGSLVKTLALSAGDHVEPLPSGVYLVRVGERVRKILVK